MSLYEDRFDTDWDSLDREAALERAFALGVAASLGERNREEFEAIHREMGSNYDASIVELAYKEGKQKGLKRKRDADTSDDRQDVWDAVLDEELEDGQPGSDDDDPAERATDMPSAVSDRTDATERPTPDEAEQTDFPDFLE